MLDKEKLDYGMVRVTFRVSHKIWADQIALVGNFNNWDAHRHLLRQTRQDGDWHITMDLEACRSYRFRYLVDDQMWMDDDHADGCEPNAYQGFDSVVTT